MPAFAQDAGQFIGPDAVARPFLEQIPAGDLRHVFTRVHLVQADGEQLPELLGLGAKCRITTHCRIASTLGQVTVPSHSGEPAQEKRAPPIESSHYLESCAVFGKKRMISASSSSS